MNKPRLDMSPLTAVYVIFSKKCVLYVHKYTIMLHKLIFISIIYELQLESVDSRIKYNTNSQFTTKLLALISSNILKCTKFIKKK